MCGSTPRHHLKAYTRLLAAYHLHPESKFENGDYSDFGPTSRRTIDIAAIHHIGKEAHRWEEQFYLGRDADAQLKFGTSPEDYKKRIAEINSAIATYGITAIAKMAGISRQHLSGIISGEKKASERVLRELVEAVSSIGTSQDAFTAESSAILKAAADRSSKIGLRRFAKLAELEPGNISRLFAGSRRMTKPTMVKIKRALGLSLMGSDHA